MMFYKEKMFSHSNCENYLICLHILCHWNVVKQSDFCSFVKTLIFLTYWSVIDLAYVFSKRFPSRSYTRVFRIQSKYLTTVRYNSFTIIMLDILKEILVIVIYFFRVSWYIYFSKVRKISSFEFWIFLSRLTNREFTIDWLYYYDVNLIPNIHWRLQKGVRALDPPLFGRSMHLNGDIWLDPLFILGWDHPFFQWLNPPLILMVSAQNGRVMSTKRPCLSSFFVLHMHVIFSTGRTDNDSSISVEEMCKKSLYEFLLWFLIVCLLGWQNY